MQEISDLISVPEYSRRVGVSRQAGYQHVHRGVVEAVVTVCGRILVRVQPADQQKAA